MNRAATAAVIILGLGFLAVVITFGLAVADLRGDETTRALWTWAGRAWTAVCGVIPLALMALLAGGVYLALRYGATYARTHAPLVYHQHGLLPAVADTSVRVIADHRNERAEVAQAIFDGHVDRANTGGVRALLNPPPGEAVLPDPAPALPDQVDIFTAPLPDRPALLLGHGPRGPITLDLDEGGHVLVGGSPRTGKTNLLASIVALAARQSPRGETVQVALCDLKRIDFALLPGDLALLRWPVATTIPDALAMVRAVEAELDRRLALLAAAHVRTVGDYNRRGGERLPYLLQVIDEIGELSAHPDRDVRDAFTTAAQRVGQLGSAAGIMQILATQRPSAKVITRAITGICDTRIALKVATMIESQLILDAPGAESLPAVRGRALMRVGGDIVQAQTYYAGLRDGRFDRLLHSLPRLLRLPADAEADGLGADDQPDGPAVQTAVRSAVLGAVQPQWGGNAVFTASAPVVPQSVPQAVPPGKRAVPDGVPDEDLMQEIYRAWLRSRDSRSGRRSLSQAQRDVFGYDGGQAFVVAAYAVNLMLRRRGHAPQYKEHSL